MYFLTTFVQSASSIYMFPLVVFKFWVLRGSSSILQSATITAFETDFTDILVGMNKTLREVVVTTQLLQNRIGISYNRRLLGEYQEVENKMSSIDYLPSYDGAVFRRQLDSNVFVIVPSKK